MKVLLIGSGGREHALAWKISKSKRVSKVFCAPGNAGISKNAVIVPIQTDDMASIEAFCKKELIDLVVIGPEQPLTLGLADRLRAQNIPVIGAGKSAAQLESSKVFAKKILEGCGVPTAAYAVFEEPSAAQNYLAKRKFPLVIKADGLAAGKGVVIAQSLDEANAAVDDMMHKKIFKDAGKKIVVEEFLIGEETSILAFVDGTDFVSMVSAQDHKKVFDQDKGPNTGGMGAYSPAPIVSKQLLCAIEKDILKPVVEAIAKEGIYYQGILYAGLMITDKGPYVLEFNVRFGDPETQVVLPMLETDIVDIFESQINHKISSTKVSWNKGACLCVVMASGGYPGTYQKGKVITGLEDAESSGDVVVFHAGTKSENGNIVTDGGRVLGVTALGKTIDDAYRAAYRAVYKIHFEQVHFRTDIGYRALQRVEPV